MKRKYIFYLLLFFITTLSCNSKKVATYIEINLKNDPKDYLVSELFENVEFIPLETSNQSRLADINNVLYFNRTYIISDIRQKCLLGFDEKGKFQFKIFPMGKGPLELNTITDFTINQKDSLIDVYDFSQKKIISFDMMGQAVREKKIKYFFREFACTSTGDYVLYAPDLENSGSIKPGAFVVDSLGEFKYSFLTTSTKGQYFQPINCLSGYGDSILLVSNYSKNIFTINNDIVEKRFLFLYPDNWAQSLILSNGSGALMTFIYRKQAHLPETKVVYLNTVTGKKYYLNFLFNDLFGLPIAIPSLFQDSRTLLVFVNAEQKDEYYNLLNQSETFPNTDKELIHQLKGILSKMKVSDNYLLVKLTIKD